MTLFSESIKNIETQAKQNLITEISSKDLVNNLYPHIQHHVSSNISKYIKNNPLTIRALELTVKESLSKALLSHQKKVIENKWLGKTTLSNYLIATIRYVCMDSLDTSHKQALKICYLCSLQDIKTILQENSNNIFYCNVCLTTDNEHAKFSKKLYEIYSKVTIMGLKCPDCEAWIPKNYVDGNIVICPFICSYIGEITSFKNKSCPSRFIKNYNHKVIDNINYNLNSFVKYDPLSNLINTDPKVNLQELSLNIISKFIDKKINLCEKKNNTQVQIAIYKAIKNIVTENEEMLDALIFDKSIKHQHKFFQEYVKLIEEMLPFAVSLGDKKHTILSLTDKKLNLFMGESEFEAEIDENLVINNNTIEHYIGTRDNNDYGKCFIGQLIDIIDLETKESILSFVDSYDFNKIQLSEGFVGKKVIVKHFRIASHYQVHSMSHLQKIKKEVSEHVKKQLKIELEKN